jgi:hypothetical protein
VGGARGKGDGGGGEGGGRRGGKTGGLDRAVGGGRGEGWWAGGGVGGGASLVGRPGGSSVADMDDAARTGSAVAVTSDDENCPVPTRPTNASASKIVSAPTSLSVVLAGGGGAFASCASPAAAISSSLGRRRAPFLCFGLAIDRGLVGRGMNCEIKCNGHRNFSPKTEKRFARCKSPTYPSAHVHGTHTRCKHYILSRDRSVAHLFLIKWSHRSQR